MGDVDGFRLGDLGLDDGGGGGEGGWMARIRGLETEMGEKTCKYEQNQKHKGRR